MDRHSGNSGNDNGSDERNMVDLTLRLGLPYPNNNQSFVVPTSFHHSNFDDTNPSSTPQQISNQSRMMTTESAIINNGMLHQGRNAGMVNHISQNGAGRVNFFRNPIAWQSNEMANRNNTTNNNNFGHVFGIPIMSNIIYANSNYGDQISGSSASSSSSNSRGSYIDPIKRCTNINCNTNNTPMWRKGPLGPKTLCNACGIKYRKEEERKSAAERPSNC